jgi:hypothetical protein
MGAGDDSDGWNQPVVAAPGRDHVTVHGLRRFTALLALCATAALVPSPAGAVPRPLLLVLIFHDAINGGCSFLSPVHGPFGGAFSVEDRTKRTRKVVEQNGFFGFEVAPGAEHDVRVRAAGGYSARCDGEHLNRLYNACVRVPRAPSTDAFLVRCADVDADASWLYDVQYQANDGEWTDRLVQSSDRSGTFSRAASTTYRFRARTTIPGGGTNHWSRPRTATT